MVIDIDGEDQAVAVIGRGERLSVEVEPLPTPPALGQGELGSPPGLGISSNCFEYSVRKRRRHRAKLTLV
eukprot:6307281-Alexandrium_andersonii.AAC.1